MKHRVNNHRAFQRRNLWFAISLALAVLAGGFGRSTSAQQLAPQAGNDAASVKFRLDLIGDEKWFQAEQKLKQYGFTYPNEKKLDAELYRKVYSDYNLNKFSQANDTINQLLTKFETADWKDEAETLLAQTPDGVRPVAPMPAPAPMPGVGIGVGKGVGRGFGKGFEIEDSQADDDPCEFKIVVLQALFQSDLQRGIAVATDWLKPGSPQTVRCKGAALTLLARYAGKSATPVILGVARNETDLKLRAKAISVLGATNDDSVIDTLRDFALNSTDTDISEAALYALSQHNSDRAIGVLGEIAMSSRPIPLRRAAIASISSKPGEPAVDWLFKIYDADQNLEIRKAVVSGFSRRKSERAGKKLLEIAQGSDNIELRKSAISSIARRSGDQAVDILLGLYDTEKNEELRDQIINSLGGSNDPRVVHKLIEIARNPATPIERRKRAIGWLSRSKDPEVLKFLEDLLK